jgi:hypothetical protein
LTHYGRIVGKPETIQKTRFEELWTTSAFPRTPLP